MTLFEWLVVSGLVVIGAFLYGIAGMIFEIRERLNEISYVAKKFG